MMKRMLPISLLMASFFGANAQKDTAAHVVAPPPLAITGSVDGYYRYNLDGIQNNLTSFTNSINSFELGMASIRGDHSFGKGTVVVDLGFGRRAAEFSYNDSSYKTSLALVKQMYVTYQASSKVKVTLGKWATHVGYEVMDAYGNRNYSTSYMFSYGPFFHTGIKADIVTGKKSALMIGVANPTDYSTTTSSSKYAIAQFSTATSDDKWKFFLNYQGTYAGSAPKSLTQFDLVINGALNSKWGIGYNGTYGSAEAATTQKWYGSALYLNYDPTAKVGYTFRGEYFSDKDGYKALGANFMEYTLTAQWKIDNCLTIMPEIRVDNASEDAKFFKGDGSSTKTTISGLIAAVYKF